MKIFKLLLISLLLANSFIFNINGQSSNYDVYDTKSEIKESFDNLDDALIFYKENKDLYDNLVLSKDDEVLKMEYGIVEFKDNNYFKYHSLINNKIDYSLGYYEAVYIEEKDDNIYFALANDIGYIEKENVKLIPFEELDKTSIYSNHDGYLYHLLKTKSGYYTYSIKLDYKLDFLKDDIPYYSYDGHYFYDDFYLLADDLLNNSHDNAINEEPYYNYYQYLGIHSVSNYCLEEIEEYFYDYLGINSKLDKYEDYSHDYSNDELNKSNLYNEIDKFFNMESIYGTNALILLSISINESSYGKSLNSYLKNNVYSSLSFDEDNLREKGRYESIEDSINSFAKYYINDLYSNMYRDYKGVYFGDKASGINTNYSLDPYFGEKCASIYFGIDEKLGLKDYHNYSLGIGEGNLIIYKDEECKNKLFTIKNNINLSYIILDENEDSYKIIIDHKLQNQFDFDKNIAYIKKENIDNLFLGKANLPVFKKYFFDFNGGSYLGFETLNLKVKENETLSLIPNKPGNDFIGYEESDIGLVAKYQRIKNLEIIDDFKYRQYPDISNLKLKITYINDEVKIVKADSNMCRIEDDYLIIEYANLQMKLDGKNHEEYLSDLNLYKEAIENNDFVYLNNSDFLDYDFSFSELRKIDKDNDLNRNYYIKGSDIFSVSGLNLSLKEKSSLPFLDDTYYIYINEINEKEKILKYGNAYGFEECLSFNIGFGFDYEDINMTTPLVISVKPVDKDNESIYTVYHLNENGDIQKCLTIQSNSYVSFIIREAGDYIVFKKKGFNTYNIDDTLETINENIIIYDNYAANTKFIMFIIVYILVFILTLNYYLIVRRKEKLWKDYRKQFHQKVIVQEEEQKN